MNRDELFEDRLADAGYLVGAIDEAGDHVTLVEAPVGEVIRIVREALLSEWSVERAARALYETDREEYDGDKPWPPRPHFIEDMYRERARAAFTAATGDE